MTFSQFRDAVRKRFDEIQASVKTLFTTDCGSKEKEEERKKRVPGEQRPLSPIYQTYLNAFDESVRQGFTCSCCERFINQFGDVVAIIGNKMVTPWDVTVNDEQYQRVADAMRDKVLASKVDGLFVTRPNKVWNSVNKKGDLTVGVPENKQMLESGQIVVWNHFYCEIEKKHLCTSADSNEAIAGQFNTNRGVFERGLKELTVEALEVALELIATDSLSKGDSYRENIKAFLRTKNEYDKLAPELKDNFVWAKLAELHVGVTTLKNTAVGTFLAEVSAGEDLDVALEAYNKKTDPTNFQRKKRAPTAKEAEKALAEMRELGLDRSLETRFAVSTDVSASDILFVDRGVSLKKSDPLLALAKSMPVNAKSTAKMEEVSIEDFIKNVLPTLNKLELQVDSRHEPNFMSVLKQVDETAPNMNKWGNFFRHWYNNDVAESDIKQRVAAAGGNVNAVIRVSLGWHNGDDLDLHLVDPNNEEIYFGHRHSRASGMLDVDMNGMDKHDYENPVENIVLNDINRIPNGTFAVFVDRYSSRSGKGKGVGFTIEIEFDGQIHQFNSNHNSAKNSREKYVVFKYDATNGLEIVSTTLKGDVSTGPSKQIWGVQTKQFTKVKMVMRSPNYWEGVEPVGNKHTFFILEDCVNPEQPRGYFQEFMNADFRKYSRFLEVVGDKLRVESSTDQLSGVGFSSTQRNSVIVKATGAIERVLKINF